MKPSPEYIVSAFIIVLGILAIIYKPYYEPDKRINLRKASIYQGWSLIVFGLYLLLLKVILDILEIPIWWVLGVVVGAIALVILLFRLKKACNIRNDSEFDESTRGEYQWRAGIAKRYALVFAVVITVAVFTGMLTRPRIFISDQQIKVGGVFGFEYPLGDIVQIDTVQGYPHIELMQGGSGFGSLLKGTFKLEGYGTGRLFLKKEIRPFIYIKFRNNDFVFLNLKSNMQTIDFYNELVAKTKNL
jgi:Ca2+/Na+ antiporter